ncbi:MAG: heat-inducible transcriptional repressor HrcA [Alphaproteobacteria bacterium]|jgi:heat-inducible transcriptional repressor|nr:heat-inducible transcriptional repressor HrcA [Alphaproteobacteria bacterium]|tara:strand:- start:9871 stop:10905 length:1035 start_codon:yes stop_codon:yes gene_type:complete
MVPKLNQRSREILRQIIDAYLQTGEAVGSRTLSQRLGVELSPATVRNVMSDLQDAGLLYSPHVSAGRLPTEAGLRFFVDGLLEVGRLTEDEQASIESQCAAQGRNPQKTLEEASRVLSGLSNHTSLVVVPKTDVRLKHIEFVALGPERAIVVLVTDDGAVENRVIDIPVGLPSSVIVEATNFLSARMVGKTLEEGQAQIAAELHAHRQELDFLTQRLVEAGMATSASDGESSVLIVSGTERLLDDVQAVEDLERVKALYGALETKESWSWLLDATKSGEGVQIFIGAEDELFNLTGCSVVVAPYTNSKQQIVGAIGVIGPARLNYARVIPVVDYTAKVIGRLVG